MGLLDKIKTAKTASPLFDEIPDSRMFALEMQAKISVAIHRARKERGMSQAQFAEFLGVSQTMVSKWESGENNFTISSWADLSYKLSIPFDPRAISPAKAVTTNIIPFPAEYTANSPASSWNSPISWDSSINAKEG